ncbi:MAG TPA: 4-hydroxy-tetrahydrodipicolinate synthase [Gaiellaceae bacterium]
MLGEALTAIVTPFKTDGTIDFERFSDLALYLVENGSDGIVVAGTTGESPTLTDDERLELFRVAVDTLNGRATVVAGTGTYSTAHSVHLTREAHELGVDAFLVVTPYYSKPPARGIVEHFRAIADVSDRPIVVYNIPGRVVINIEPETIVELAEIPSVRAVKQANDDFVQARRIVSETDLTLYAGDDVLIFPFLELGGIGGICVHTHVVGPQVRRMIRSFHEGDVDTARQLHEELQPAYELLQVQVNPIAIKAALNLLGHGVGGLRLPLVEASEGEVARVRDCLERLGVLSGAPV